MKKLLSLFLLLFVVNNSSCMEDSEQDNSMNSNTDNLEQYLDLEKLSNSELETICTTRGFEVIKETTENGTEVEYTRDDYLEAASQCLAIEAEMEKVLQENPNILDDLKEESQNLTKEKEKLEAELSEQKSKLSNEEEILAFIPKEEEKNSNETVSISEEEEIIDLDVEESKQVEKETIESSTTNSPSERNDEQEETSIPKNITDHTVKQEKDISNFTTKDIFMEIKKQIQRDITNVINIILPKSIRDPIQKIVTPLTVVMKSSVSSAIDIIKRYMVAILGLTKKEQPVQQQS